MAAALPPASRAQTPTAADLDPSRRPVLLQPEVPALEGALDPQAYVIGPGDIFAFAIGGARPIEQRATVTADGLLIVPEVGSFRVAERTLAAVRAELRQALQRRYANVATDAALAEPRRFAVHVGGAVATPGRHVVGPAPRLEEALTAAMGESPLVALRTQQTAGALVQPALRNVEVRRADGGAPLSIDLLRYYATGDPRYNPYLRDGDAVRVPTFEVSGGVVFVDDRFSGGRPYDLRPDDTAADLIEVARGPGVVDRLESVRLARMGPDGEIAVQVLAASDLARGAAASVSLRPLDRLILVDVNETVSYVSVTGEVRYPGTYSFARGETTLREALEAAGGLREGALVRAAYLERSELPALSEFEVGRLSGLPFESRLYLTREAASYRRVAVDLEAVLTGTAPPILLRNGDRLFVPRDPGGVVVAGQVRQPALIPYREGADADYYVAAAGGLGPAATEVYVREVATGDLRPAAGATIRSGDYLFVDREPAAFSEAQQGLLLQRERAESQERFERNESRYRFYGTLISAVGTLLSAVALYATITRS